MGTRRRHLTRVAGRRPGNESGTDHWVGWVRSFMDRPPVGCRGSVKARSGAEEIWPGRLIRRRPRMRDSSNLSRAAPPPNSGCQTRATRFITHAVTKQRRDDGGNRRPNQTRPDLRTRSARLSGLSSRSSPATVAEFARRTCAVPTARSMCSIIEANLVLHLGLYGAQLVDQRRLGPDHGLLWRPSCNGPLSPLLDAGL